MWRVFRERQRAFLTCALLTALLAVVSVEFVFPSLLKALGPALGSMALVVAELLGALLIDLPLAGLAGVALAYAVPEADDRHGVVLGFVFLTVLCTLVVLFVGANVLVPFSTLFQAMGPVVRSARDELGLRLAGYVVLFFVFDFLGCALFGTVGIKVGRLLRRLPTDHQDESSPRSTDSEAKGRV